MICRTFWPLVMRKRTTVDWVTPRLSEAMTVRPSGAAASRRRSGVGGVGGVGGGGRMPVLMNPHRGSLQPAMTEGNAGGLEAEFGSLSAMNGSTVLPGPPLAVPVAVELVMVPTGKLEPGIDPDE